MCKNLNTLRAELANLKSLKAELKEMKKMNELRNLSKELEMTSEQIGKNPSIETLRSAIKSLIVSRIDVLEETTIPELIIAEGAIEDKRIADALKAAEEAAAAAEGRELVVKHPKARAKKAEDTRVKLAVRDCIVGQRIQYPNNAVYQIIDRTTENEVLTIVMQTVTATGCDGKVYNVKADRFLNVVVAIVEREIEEAPVSEEAAAE
jgi:hypothetical protein